MAPSAPKVKEPPADPVDPPPRGDGQIPDDILAKLKAETVFIKRHAGRESATGSGFVLRVSGDSVLIVTNEHVAVPKVKQEIARPAELEVVFHSGRKNKFTMKGELIAADAEHDLAIIRVSGASKKRNFPSSLNSTELTKLSETMPIYIIGFPFGQGRSTTRGNPAVTIGRGSISSLREDETGGTIFIQIDGELNPGNSGEPVVDARGRLVGVTVAMLAGTNIGLAIPTTELTRVLTGRVSNLMFRLAGLAGRNVEIDVKGDLVDPLKRVKSTSVRVARADDLKARPRVGIDGKWSARPGTKSTAFRASGGTVICRVQLPFRDGDRKIEFYFQFACVDRDGKTNYFALVMATLNITEDAGENPCQPFLPSVDPGGPGSSPPSMGPGGESLKSPALPRPPDREE